MTFVIFRLPEWTKSIFYPGSNLSYTLEFELFKSQTLTPEMARLKMGFLLRDILTQFDGKAKNQPGTPQIQMYSGQDYTIASMLSGLNLIDVRLSFQFVSRNSVFFCIFA